MSVSREIALYGTEISEPEPIIFETGPLSFWLDGGTVRYIRYHGTEAIRGIDYLVRDANWATPTATLSEIDIRRQDGFIRVRFNGMIETDDIHYRYQAEITASAKDGLRFQVTGEALKAFDTNRTGFTILHPIDGIAGSPVVIEHTDGTKRNSCFPKAVSAGQPIFDIRALSHEPASGLTCTCRMEAELPHDPKGKFEMEDQRNWTDASYKTYVASLLDPWPYRLEPGRTWTQTISVSFEGAPEAKPISTSGAKPTGRMPLIGLGVMPDQLDTARARLAEIPNVDLLTCYADLGGSNLPETLGSYAEISGRIAAEIQLELVLPLEKSPREELMEAAALCAQAGLEPQIVLPCPAPYLKSTQPVGPWPDVPDLAHIYNEARNAFPKARIAGGMLSYFTELNRKPPPVACIDLISHTTTPIVHAGDDVSVMETLEALPQLAFSTGKLAPGVPYRIGPSAIPMRHNPYGAATLDNSENTRLAMAGNDPRQRGLFAAAWTAGYVARLADAGLEAITLNHIAGASGILHEKHDWPAPWFDEQSSENLVYPVYHVMRFLAKSSGKSLRHVEIPKGCTGFAFEGGGIIANLSKEPAQLGRTARILDVSEFQKACTDMNWLDQAKPQSNAMLDQFAVAFFDD